ncbi:MAG: hypothetical protein AAFO82_15885 [Bacteroidota bacterium]
MGKLYHTSPPAYSIVVGDEIIFREGVFWGSYRNPSYLGDRYIWGSVIRESYGRKGQHTFSIEIIDCKGVNADEILLKKKKKKPLVRKGRNIYKDCVKVKEAEDFEEKQEDKYLRSREAKFRKYMIFWNEASDGRPEKADKIPENIRAKLYNGERVTIDDVY